MHYSSLGRRMQDQKRGVYKDSVNLNLFQILISLELHNMMPKQIKQEALNIKPQIELTVKQKKMNQSTPKSNDLSSI